jgi:hypothetical protein
MDTEQPAPSRRRTTAIIAAAGLACLAIALPVSGAFAEGDSNTDSGTAPAQTQYGQGQESAPDREGAPDQPCPEDRGGEGQGSDSSGTAPSGDSVAL